MRPTYVLHRTTRVSGGEVAQSLQCNDPAFDHPLVDVRETATTDGIRVGSCYAGEEELAWQCARALCYILQQPLVLPCTGSGGARAHAVEPMFVVDELLSVWLGWGNAGLRKGCRRTRRRSSAVAVAFARCESRRRCFWGAKLSTFSSNSANPELSMVLDDFSMGILSLIT
jgi:hypothetical protein